MMEFHSVADLKAYATALPRQWGPWRLDRENLQLTYVDRGTWIYSVDLERCLDSAGMLDWIMQVNGKQWAEDDREVVAGLVDALDDVLYPQGNICGGGADRPITKDMLMESVEKAATTWPDMLIGDGVPR